MPGITPLPNKSLQILFMSHHDHRSHRNRAQSRSWSFDKEAGQDCIAIGTNSEALLLFCHSQFMHWFHIFSIFKVGWLKRNLSLKPTREAPYKKNNLKMSSLCFFFFFLEDFIPVYHKSWIVKRKPPAHLPVKTFGGTVLYILGALLIHRFDIH